MMGLIWSLTYAPFWGLSLSFLDHMSKTLVSSILQKTVINTRLPFQLLHHSILLSSLIISSWASLCHCFRSKPVFAIVNLDSEIIWVSVLLGVCACVSDSVKLQHLDLNHPLHSLVSTFLCSIPQSLGIYMLQKVWDFLLVLPLQTWQLFFPNTRLLMSLWMCNHRAALSVSMTMAVSNELVNFSYLPVCGNAK